MPRDGFEYDMKKFKEILNCAPDSILEIPRYQREYEWETDEIESLLSDFYEHYNINKQKQVEQRRSYFCGTMVVHKKIRDDKTIQNIVDGQQRITSITLIAAVMRDIIDRASIAYPQLAQSGFHNPYNENLPITFDRIKANIDELLHESDTGHYNSHLTLRQLDRRRLDWIRLLWTQKTVDSICQATFDVRKRGRPNGGLPDQDASKIRNIYSNYLHVWRILGQFDDSDEGLFQDLGILHNELNHQGKPSTILPHGLANNAPALKSWSPRGFDDVKQTIQKIWNIAWCMMDDGKVMEISVEDEWLAHTIFDRANTAGKKLANIDVIRAKIFSKASFLNVGETVEDEIFNKMQEIYDSDPERGTVNEFVKQFATMCAGEKITGSGTQEHYNQAISEIGSRQVLVDYVNKFVDAFEVYYNVIAKPDLNQGASWIKAYSKDFAYTKFKQHRPLMLKILTTDGIEEEKYLKMQRCLETIYIIHNLLMNGSPSAIETMMAEQINNITDNDSVDRVINSLFTTFKGKSTFNQEIGEAMTRESFKARLKKNSFSQSQAHFLLRNKIRLDSVTPIQGLPGVLVSAKGGHVEHILPQDPENWDDKWKDNGNPSEIHSKMVNRIGNLTLLDAGTNSSLGNKSWPEKKEIFSGMGWAVTSAIAEEEDWDEEQINQRGETLVEWIADIWWHEILNSEEAAEDGAPEEAAAEDGAPEEAAAEDGAPEEAAAQDGAPEEAAAQDGAPEEAAAQDGAPEEAAAQEQAEGTGAVD